MELGTVLVGQREIGGGLSDRGGAAVDAHCGTPSVVELAGTDLD
jgi:hypothetical protein